MEPGLELQEIVVDDRLTGRTEITGWVIGDTNTDDGDSREDGVTRPRVTWTRNRVVRTPSGLYVIIREAYSRIYHTQPTACVTVAGKQRGWEVTRAELIEGLADLGLTLDDAVSCNRCEPAWPEDLKAGAKVRFEFPRISTDQCENRAQVTSRLTRRKRHSGVETAGLPESVRMLLEQCLHNDPDWAAADKPVVRIS